MQQKSETKRGVSMKSLKIAFSILLCITILSVGASVVCAVIAANTAEYFRDYRSSVITTLSSVHGQLNSTKRAFTDALARLDGLQNDTEGAIDASTAPETTAPETEIINWCVRLNCGNHEISTVLISAIKTTQSTKRRNANELRKRPAERPKATPFLNFQSEDLAARF